MTKNHFDTRPLLCRLANEAVGPDELAEIQQQILAGICPFCAAGPFARVATHIYCAHELTTRELRDLAGFTYSESILSPTTREKYARNGKKKGFKNLQPAKPGRKCNFSKVGEQRVLANIEEAIGRRWKKRG